MIGKVDIQLGLITHRETTLKANVARIAKEFLTPIQLYNKMSHDAMKLNEVEFKVPYKYSLMAQQDKDIVLSTLKKPENSEGIILRLYNPADNQKISFIKFNEQLKKIYKTKLNERKIEIIKKDSNEFELKFNKNQAQTVLALR